MFLISYQTGQWQNPQNLQLQLDDSDSERKYRKTAEIEFSEPFHNKFTKKSEDERFQSFKIYREDNNMQIMAKLFSTTAGRIMIALSCFLKREAIENGYGSLSIFLSFMDQDLMILELRYKQYAEDFNGINTFHREKVLIAKKRWTQSLSFV